MKLFPNWKQYKGKIAFLLAIALMATAVLPGAGVLKVQAAEGDPVFTDGFETGAWFDKGGGVPGISSGDAKVGDKYLTVSSGNVSNYDGVIVYDPSGITPNKVYNYSYWVKLVNDVSDADVALKIIGVCGESGNYNDQVPFNP
jgi:hypothetical protein